MSRIGVYKRQTNLASYEVTDHLCNVRSVIQENPNPFSILLSYADYYAFGEQLPSRNTSSNYRYAFQGQELDKETGMEAFQLRLWDGRIGRWLSPDPYGEFFSPYLGMGNNPVSMVDPDGGFASRPGDPGKGFFGRLFSSIGSIFSSKSQEITYDEGTLKEVIVRAKPKSVGSGIYGWNDGSAERFWNEYMPLTSSFYTFYKGAETGNKTQMAMGSGLFLLDIASFGEGSLLAKSGGRTVETYALTAKSAGFYPVMTRGSKKATELVFLEAGEVWKYGVTKNPLTRYSQKYLKNVGEFGLEYKTLFDSKIRSEALSVEKMMIQQYEACMAFYLLEIK